ncbi:hypothetical protein Bcell_0195 [Evansella cellulosilytica DSM 2522]|uniref:Uncharacterized protein n=1 Tax=Evansella cellulosilytica (strain ATCC 21833 / DSM 2522 / FERM P-1141 / JCM 9156 / N-4) TaxID=649639 RepID=E6TU24_EVAC2|nr:hypothetical protein Bcell_0195 [Evansella cellulosilytica DSM 2522]
MEQTGILQDFAQEIFDKSKFQRPQLQCLETVLS